MPNRELSILFISGYLLEWFRNDLQKLPQHRVRFLQKPFSPEKLLREVDALLAEKNASSSE